MTGLDGLEGELDKVLACGEGNLLPVDQREAVGLCVGRKGLGAEIAEFAAYGQQGFAVGGCSNCGCVFTCCEQQGDPVSAWTQQGSQIGQWIEIFEEECAEDQVDIRNIRQSAVEVALYEGDRRQMAPSFGSFD